MDHSIDSIIGRLSSQPGAGEESIDEASSQLNIQLPDDYRQFLLTSNGVKGPIGDDSYLVLWSVDELISLNEAYHVDEFAPGLVLIGSDGGDIAYALDSRGGRYDYVQVPFIGMSLDESEVLAENFEEFLQQLQNAGSSTR
jgi:cell wall assembly regulator SMI1